MSYAFPIGLIGRSLFLCRLTGAIQGCPELALEVGSRGETASGSGV